MTTLVRLDCIECMGSNRERIKCHDPLCDQRDTKRLSFCGTTEYASIARVQWFNANDNVFEAANSLYCLFSSIGLFRRYSCKLVLLCNIEFW